MLWSGRRLLGYWQSSVSGMGWLLDGLHFAITAYINIICTFPHQCFDDIRVVLVCWVIYLFAYLYLPVSIPISSILSLAFQALDTCQLHFPEPLASRLPFRFCRWKTPNSKTPTQQQAHAWASENSQHEVLQQLARVLWIIYFDASGHQNHWQVFHLSLPLSDFPTNNRFPWFLSPQPFSCGAIPYFKSNPAWNT